MCWFVLVVRETLCVNVLCEMGVFVILTCLCTLMSLGEAHRVYESFRFERTVVAQWSADAPLPALVIRTMLKSLLGCFSLLSTLMIALSSGLLASLKNFALRVTVRVLLHASVVVLNGVSYVPCADSATWL